MLKNALARLRAAHRARTPEQARGGRVRLVLPASMSATLGCDAVGVPARHGFHLMSHLPRTGCVFADADRWWWIVPADSDLDLAWPEQVTYARDADVPAGRPRLIHSPDGLTPYTPPIPLFLMVCQVTGVAPTWATAGAPSVVSAP
ncbi:hypothetical protein ACH4KN_29450 [Streptomyces sp. NPDC017546]|uniref:hypothetical protein n=1 Tax=unclassified Streptomyces TaxID=2593676 RepID=UPI002362F33C|nr:hypothetical protein [Streptomyces sp. MMBL 11-1]